MFLQPCRLALIIPLNPQLPALCQPTAFAPILLQRRAPADFSCCRIALDHYHVLIIFDRFNRVLTCIPWHRLYRAPVESDINDIKTKATRARSAIRRTRRSRIGDGPVPVPASASASASSQARWRRSRGTPPTAESQWTPWDNLEPTDPSPVPQTTQRSISNHNSQGPLSGARPPHPAIREVIGRNGPMNDEIVALFGERMARLYQGTSSRPAPLDATEGNGPAASSAPTDADPRSWILPSDRPMPTPPSHVSDSFNAPMP